MSSDSAESDTTSHPVPLGRIDLHAHLLPGVDDGCVDLQDSLDCIAILKQAGYVGTVCTPHVWGERYPSITTENIAAWTDALRRELQQREIDYRLWPGGELRISKQAVEWMKTFGVPTLGDSRCVLMDTWDRGWSKQVDRTAEWLLSEGYQPILAHPERSAPNADPHHKYHRNLNRLSKTDVLLQGNLKCFDEGESTLAGQLAHQWLHEGRYDLLALDLHHPESLPPRLAGIDVVRDLVGEATADALITKTPRRLLLGA